METSLKKAECVGSVEIHSPSEITMYSGGLESAALGKYFRDAAQITVI